MEKKMKDVIEYLEGEKELLLAELKYYDSQLDTNNMTVQEIDALVLRKRLYDIERHIKIVRTLTGNK